MTGPSGRERGSRVEKVVHRGIRWQRAPSGRVRWWNEEDEAWVGYRPGDDAPPRPPGWDTARGPEQPPPLTRPKWRSPYRIVPIVLAVFVIGVGLWQALTSGSPASNEAKQAQALDGKCLKQAGTNRQGPIYSDTPVACSAPDAAVRVVAVLPGVASHPGPAPACPAGSSGVVLLAGVARPHIECVARLHP